MTVTRLAWMTGYMPWAIMSWMSATWDMAHIQALQNVCGIIFIIVTHCERNQLLPAIMAMHAINHAYRLYRRLFQLYAAIHRHCIISIQSARLCTGLPWLSLCRKAHTEFVAWTKDACSLQEFQVFMHDRLAVLHMWKKQASWKSLSPGQASNARMMHEQ